jgi:hypothetical protein
MKKKKRKKHLLVKDRELNGNGKSCWWWLGKMEGGPRNESIILQLDSESRFRDALEKKKKLKEEKGRSRSPKREKKKKKKIFWSGHCQAPVSITEAQHFGLHTPF